MRMNGSSKISAPPKAEELSTNTADFLQLVIDTIPALVVSALPDGSVDFVNQGWRDYTGLPLESLKGWGWSSVIHPEDLTRFTAEWEQARSAGKPFHNQARVRRADGEYRWFVIRKAPLRDESGNIIKWYGTGSDIEDFKQAEVKIRKNEAELRQVIDAIPAHVIAFRPDGLGLFANRQALEYTGFNLRDVFIDDWIARTVHPEDAERVRGVRESLLAREEPFAIEARIRAKTGQYRWFLVRVNPLKHDDGTVVGWYATRTDIEDLKNAEHELRRSKSFLAKSNAKLEEAERITHVGYWEWDLATDRVNWSDEVYRIYGLEPQQPPMDLATVRGKIHPEDWWFVSEAIEEALAGGAPFNIVCRVLRPTGEARILHSQGDVKRDAAGRPYQMFGTTQDITDHRLAEDELRRSRFYLSEGERLAHMGSWAFNPSGFFDHWSRELFQIYGLDATKEPPTLEAYLGRIHPEDREFMRSLIEQMVAESLGCDVTKRIVRPDGEVRYVRCVGAPIVDEGALKRIVGSALDVTEHELLTRELRRREAYLAEAQRLSHTGSFGWRPEHGEIVWSDETYRIFQVDPPINPTLSLILERTHPDDVGNVRERLERAAQLREAFDLEHRLLLQDGATKHVHVVAHAIEDNAGNLELVGAITDITERREASVALEKAFHEIKELKDQLYKENLVLKEEIDRSSMFEEIVGASQPLRAVLSRVSKVAPADSTVLITGETGTGKELIARAVHKRSARAQRAFVSVNCAAIPSALVASELFGHEKGAFTGALQRRLGRFELADGGTIFLDEVGELPVETQIALLRVLQERTFERVGGHQTISTDVRVIAATNRDLQASVAAGTFRSDLYYRLNVFPIPVPPLRERSEDIPMLVEYFVDRYASKAGKKIRSISKKTMDRLTSYPWPGNIRELQNVIERSIILCEGDVFSVDESWLSSEAISAPAVKLSQKIVSQEREMIEAALARSKGRVSGSSGAAAKLGLPPSTLESKIRSLKIDKRRFA